MTRVLSVGNGSHALYVMGLMRYTYTYLLSNRSHTTGNGTYSLGNWTQNDIDCKGSLSVR